MSDNIDIPIEASGDDGVNRLTSAIDRLTASMERLGETSAAGNLAKQMEQMQGAMNTALGTLTMQMQEMKQVLATGFADISATNEKLIEGMGARQVRAIEESGEKAAAALDAAGLKIKAADARTWEQIGRGSASNVTAAFYQLAQGIPVEAVEARFGQLATSTAAGLNGQLEQLKQFQANAKSLYQTDYKPLAGATAAEIEQANAMNAAWGDAMRVKSASNVDPRTLLGLPSEAEARSIGRSIAAQFRAGVAEEKAALSVDPRTLLGLPAEAEMKAFGTQLAIEMRTAAERAGAASSVDPRTLLGLPSEAESHSIGRSIAAQFRAGVEAEKTTVSVDPRILLGLPSEAEMHAFGTQLAINMRTAVEEESLRAKSAPSVDARTLLGLPSETEVRSMGQQIAAQMREAAALEQAKLRLNTLDAAYATASPTSQVRTAAQAQLLASMSGQEAAAQRFGPLAASAGALAAAEARLAESAAAAGLAHGGLNGALRQAESVFKGAAHEAGVYGLAHGQLIALLAGGALAAALHHIAETGAEVQFELASLSAFSASMEPVDVNKFVGITAGTLTGLKDAAEGVHALAEAGLNQTQAFAALPDVMRLASLGEMSVAQAAEMGVESMHAFGKEVADLDQIGDILVAVGTKSNVSVHRLAEDMKSAATMGELLGMTMEETAAAVGTLAERGLTIQPLSSAMLKLYEPSDKAAKVIKQLGLEVKDQATGAFRPFSDIIADLSGKLMQFSSSGATDTLKAMGFSSRDIKAMEAMTQHLDDYQHLLHEAENSQGKMFDAMTVKEDTVKGAWERLGSTLDGTLVKGFQNASPVIQQVENDLMHLVGSGGAVELVTNLAAGFARLTQVLVENAGIIGSVVAGYVALKAISGLTTLTVEFTVAELAATRAMAANRVETAAAGAQLSLFAVEEEAAGAGAGALEARLLAAGAGARLFSAAFGWIAVAATAAITAYELLSGKVSEVDGKYQAAINTSNTTIDAYDREIERLREMNYQLEHVGTNAQEAGGKLALIGLQGQKAQLELSLQQYDSKMAAYNRGEGPNPMGWSWNDPRKELQGQLDQVNEALAKLGQKQTEMAAERSKNSLLEDARKINDALAHIPLADDMSAKLGIKDPAVIQSLQERRKEIQFTVVDEKNHAEVLEKVKQLELDINAAKKPGLTPVVGDKDIARVRIEQLQEELRLMQEASKIRVDDLKSQNKRGDLGDLQLINEELAEKLKLDQKALDMAIAEKAAAGPLKPGQQERYNSRIKSAAARLGPDGLDAQAAERQRLDAIDQMNTEELQARAKALASMGQLEQAYLIGWEAKYGDTLARINADIADSRNEAYRQDLERYKAHLEEMRRLGANDARFREAKNDFGAASAELNQRLNYLRLQSGPGTGLGSQLSNMADQRDVYADMLPQMQAAQSRVQALSSVMYSGPDAKEKLKEAKNELAEIQSQMAAMRNAAVTMGEAIAKALTEAYGKGGAALGGMITTATAYDTKMKEIQATLASSGNTEADKQKAAEATASAQIKAYSDMAGAAKGFFDANSNGYKIMAAAEKAFRVMELVEAGATLAKKLGFKTTEVTATVAADGIKTASGTAATAADVANAGASSSAWGITAVVKAIASMPFPMNLVAGAATLAAVTAVGAKVMGAFGGSDTTAQDRQAAQGTGTVLGDPNAKTDSIAKSLTLIQQNTYDGLTVSQGMLTSLQAIETNISSFAGLLMQTAGFSTTAAGTDLSAGIGASIPLVGHLLSSIFGGKQTLDDTGFTMNAATLGQIASQGVSARTYADITTSGGWFRGDSHDTKTMDLSSAANQQIGQIITSIGDTVKAAGAALGLDGNQLAAQLSGFVVDIGKVSLKGLSSADQQAAIQAVFSKLGDQMASSAVSTITQFSKAGEGALETLTRVATDYQAVDAVFKSFGTTFGQVGTASIAARENLINLAGGLDKFTSQAEYLLKNFLTQGQQAAALHAAIDPTLAKYGLSTSSANALQQFANVTIAFGQMGDAGAAAYTELMQIAPAFKRLVDAGQDLQNQLNQLTLNQTQQDAIARAQLDPANQALFDQVQQAKLVSQAKADLVTAYQAESQSIQTAIDRLKSFSQSLRSFVNSLQLGALSPLNPTDKYGAALAQFNDTLVKAQHGDTVAQSNLQSAAQAFLQASRDANASNSTYQADYQRVVAATSGMADWADSQVNVGQASLNALHDQVAQLVDIHTATMTVADAINNLAIIMSAGKDTSINSTTLDTLYKELLGRPADDAGKAFYQDLLNRGIPLSVVIDDITHSAEYASYTAMKTPTSTVTPSTGGGSVVSMPASPVVSAPSPTLQIDTLYQQILGRPADAAGEAYWVDRLQNGVPLSTIADAMRQSTEARNPATATVAPPASVTEAPVVDNTPPASDPYAGIVASNAQIAAQLAAVNQNITQLRTEQQVQTDQQVTATMQAGADTADNVAGAITEASRATAWTAANKVELR